MIFRRFDAKPREALALGEALTGTEHMERLAFGPRAKKGAAA